MENDITIAQTTDIKTIQTVLKAIGRGEANDETLEHLFETTWTHGYPRGFLYSRKANSEDLYDMICEVY